MSCHTQSKKEWSSWLLLEIVQYLYMLTCWREICTEKWPLFFSKNLLYDIQYYCCQSCTQAKLCSQIFLPVTNAYNCCQFLWENDFCNIIFLTYFFRLNFIRVCFIHISFLFLLSFFLYFLSFFHVWRHSTYMYTK